MRKHLIILLICSLIFAPFATVVSAKGEHSGEYSTKDEVIYGNLATNGDMKNMYVVNSFQMTKPGDVIDYGAYNEVRNLTDLSDMTKTKNEVHFHAEEEFYYQGELKSESLPWHITITYLLDGEKINPDQLAGKSGHFEVQIETTQNKAINPVFFKYYLLQVSLTLDPLIFHDIQAPKGTEANEGKDKVISFSVMPDKEEVMIVSEHVNNLKMKPIDIVAIPANLGIDDPDTEEMTDDFVELSDAIRDIHSGVSELKSGVFDLNKGASKLSKGSNEYQQGMNELNQSSDQLVNGSHEILTVFRQISDALKDSPDMPDLEELTQLPTELRETSNILQDFAKSLNELKTAIDEIPNQTIDDEQFKEIYDALGANQADNHLLDIVAQLEATYHASQIVRDISNEISDDFIAFINDVSESLNLLADGLEEATEATGQLEDLAELQDGLLTLSSEYENFHNGLITYTDGVDTLASSYQEINKGTKELASGTADLKHGVSKLHDGTKELRDETSDLPDQMQSEIDKLLDEFDFSDYEPASFVSDLNEDVGVVQFILQTETIEIDEPDTPDEIDEKEKNIWDRFLDLFR